MPKRRPAAEPSLFVAIKWLFLAGCAVVLFLGGISFLFGSDDEPAPTPTVTVIETQLIQSSLSDDVPDEAIDDALSSLPTPRVCTDADARGEVPRDRWTPCGQVLGYFDNWMASTRASPWSAPLSPEAVAPHAAGEEATPWGQQETTQHRHTDLTATACSSEPETIRVTVTQTVTAPPSAETAADATDGVLKMGATKTILHAEADVHATVQALGYQQPYKGPQPQKPEDFQGGDIWATAEVKVCNIKGTDFSVDQFPWSLAYEDGTSVEVTGSSGEDMPKPEYPMDKTLRPSRCARGFIAFPVPLWSPASSLDE